MVTWPPRFARLIIPMCSDLQILTLFPLSLFLSSLSLSLALHVRLFEYRQLCINCSRKRESLCSLSKLGGGLKLATPLVDAFPTLWMDRAYGTPSKHQSKLRETFSAGHLRERQTAFLFPLALSIVVHGACTTGINSILSSPGFEDHLRASFENDRQRVSTAPK